MTQLYEPTPVVDAAQCKSTYGSLSAWRAALFAALGLGVANGCANDHETLLPGDGAGDVALDSTTPTTASADAGSTAAPSKPLPVCAQPASFPTIDGTSRDTGYFACEGGWYHRAERKQCPSIVPRSGALLGHIGTRPRSTKPASAKRWPRRRPAKRSPKPATQPCGKC